MKIQKLSDIKVAFKSILLYGVSGTGKTTTISKLQGKTLLIDIDMGSSVLVGLDLDNIDVVRLEAMEDLPKIIEHLEKECLYENIVIDTLSELEKTMLTYMGRKGKNDGAPELQHYNKTQFKLVDYCRRFRALNANIVFVCWEQLKDYIDPQGNKYTQAYPLLSGKTADTVLGLCDVVGRQEIMSTEKDGEKRIIRLATSQLAICKDRLNKRTWCEVEDLIIYPKVEIKETKEN